ncbi:MAG: 3-deoxy-8-phosphooctulonate synthase, partial [Kiritimatiellaeota bacterium]|nr:3-deoxy-8-phosphooctulonate synthase [Kiritimatiellota bacterium]
EDLCHAIAKVASTGNKKILLTERGATFGYNNLVADMRNLLVMRQFGLPVIFDATHSVQRPGSLGGATGGDAKWAPALARAAVATGVDGIFIETHLDPAQALSDKANAIAFAKLPALWKNLAAIHALIPRDAP